MTRKIVRWLGKILSPIPNTVTSDLNCCCGCLCCNLTKLTFQLESPNTNFGLKSWRSNVIVDYDCPYYENPIPENSPGSAYDLVVFFDDSTEQWSHALSLYCLNAPEITLNLTVDTEEVTDENNYPDGVVKFLPVLPPFKRNGESNSKPIIDENGNFLGQFSYDEGCIIKITYSDSKAVVTFRSVRFDLLAMN